MPRAEGIKKNLCLWYNEGKQKDHRSTWGNLLAQKLSPI